MAERLIEIPRWRAICAYDGTEFCGWQSQPNRQTVQDFIEARLAVVFNGFVRIHGSGRTDSGVHARGQVFHFDGVWKHPDWKLLRALRCGLPSGIQVIDIEPVNSTFHARFSAMGKRYCYQLYEGYAMPWDSRYWWSLGERRLSIEKIERALPLLLGQHDFSAFAANRADGSKENPVKNMRHLKISKDGPRIIIELEASGFLYKMARSIVGCLVEVGLEKVNPSEVSQILASKCRTHVVQTAPAQGLWLEQVFYART